jgi:hypothetical protein
MKIGTAALLGAWALSLAPGAQEKRDGGDKIGKDKPPVVARKVAAELQKRKGCAIAETVQLAFGAPQPPPPGTYTGVLRKDFAAVKGTAELYAKGPKTLVDVGGRFDPLDEIKGQDALRTSSFRNPALFLKELELMVGVATFGGDEVVGGKDCQVLDFLAPEPVLKIHLKEAADKLGRVLRGFAPGGGLGGFDPGNLASPDSLFDAKKSLATYRVCVGKSDLNVYRLEFVIRPVLKPNALPKEVPTDRLNFDTKTDVLFSKWDEEVPFDVPAAVKAKLGIP